MRHRIIVSIVAVGSMLTLAGSPAAFAFGPQGGGHGAGGAHGAGGGHSTARGAGLAGMSRGAGAGGARSFAVAPQAAAGFRGNAIQNNAAQNNVRNGGRMGGQRFAGNGGRFRGGYGGVGLGGFGYGGGYGYDGYDGGADYGYGYGDPAYGDPSYADGVQYSQAPDDESQGLQTGRSAATLGDTCSTPVKACTLYNQSYVGLNCSCKIPGGRASGHVTP